MFVPGTRTRWSSRQSRGHCNIIPGFGHRGRGAQNLPKSTQLASGGAGCTQLGPAFPHAAQHGRRRGADACMPQRDWDVLPLIHTHHLAPNALPSTSHIHSQHPCSPISTNLQEHCHRPSLNNHSTCKCAPHGQTHVQFHGYTISVRRCKTLKTFLNILPYTSVLQHTSPAIGPSSLHSQAHMRPRTQCLQALTSSWGL